VNHLAETPLFQALGWALLHSLWQGAGLGLTAWVGLRLLRHRTPGARYLLACAALGAMPVLALATLILAWPAPAPPELAPLLAAPPQPAGFRQALGPFLPYASTFWMLGVSVMGLRLLGGWYWLQRLRWKGSEPVSAAWRERVEALAARMGLGGPVGILKSFAVDAPMVIGWLRPVILVPAAALAGLDPASLEAILAHELAHIRRHDYLVNLLQAVVEALLFYHPAAWWLSRQIRAERENCCDDAAVDLCGDPVLYARALAGLEDLRHAFEPNPNLALAANGGNLMQRIRRLILPGLPPSPAGRAGLMALLAVTALGAAGLGITQEKAPQPAPEAPKAAPEPKVIRKTVRIERKSDLDAKAKDFEAKAEAFAKKFQASRKAGKAEPELEQLQKDMQAMAQIAEQNASSAMELSATEGQINTTTGEISRSADLQRTAVHQSTAAIRKVNAKAIARGSVRCRSSQSHSKVRITLRCKYRSFGRPKAPWRAIAIKRFGLQPSA